MRETKYTDVRLTRLRNQNKYSTPQFVRTPAGAAVLRVIGRCMDEGGTVSFATRYDKEGCEWLDATLVWDGAKP